MSHRPPVEGSLLRTKSEGATAPTRRHVETDTEILTTQYVRVSEHTLKRWKRTRSSQRVNASSDPTTLRLRALRARVERDLVAAQSIDDEGRFDFLTRLLESLSPHFVHGASKLRPEANAWALVRKAVDEAQAMLIEMERDLARQDRVPWYRRSEGGPPGMEDVDWAQARARLPHARAGRDPVVALHLIRDVLRVVEPVAEVFGATRQPKGGRPRKDGRTDMADMLQQYGLSTAQQRAILLDLGYTIEETGKATIRDSVKRRR